MINNNKENIIHPSSTQKTDLSVALSCELKQQGADKDKMLILLNVVKNKILNIEVRLGEKYHYDIVNELRNIRTFDLQILDGLIEQNIYFR